MKYLTINNLILFLVWVQVFMIYPVPWMQVELRYNIGVGCIILVTVLCTAQMIREKLKAKQ